MGRYLEWTPLHGKRIMTSRLRISLKKTPAMTVTRVTLAAEKLVYVICANRPIRYLRCKSPVVYVGTTQKGAQRTAQSVAFRADSVLGTHGVTTFDVRILTTKARRGIKTWRLLERALLIGFRERYGEVPRCNIHGKGYVADREFVVFSRNKIGKILEALESREAEDHEVIDAGAPDEVPPTADEDEGEGA